MKLMKTKLGLSVLALALVGAGAWSLQSPVTASAEIDMSGFKMENGASVCLDGTDVNNNAFHGIRWTTTVEPSFYTSAGASQNSKFGVIVAPTSLFEGELTHATTLTNGSNVKVLPVNSSIDASSEAVKYYSVIDYSELGASASEAYKLELTARAYVDVNGDGDYSDCIYADLTDINTSRSARQVAVSAELAGVVESANMARAMEYYGGTENVTANADFVENTGAVGTQYIDMENATTVDVAITVDGTIEEVLIGSKSVSFEYNNGTLTLTGLNDIVCGEQYVTVFTDNGIVTKPIIGATKVIDGVEDLKLFNAKGAGATPDGGTFDFAYTTKYQYVEYWAKEQEQGGYYVLANDIEAEGYKHGSRKSYDVAENEVEYNTATWNGADKYVGLPIGLTGTFNGMGYAIKDMEIASEREGFFGIVNGGTVKNVAFTDVKSALTEYAFVVANYLLNATLENVYVKTDEYETDGSGNVTSMGFPMSNSSILANYYQGQNTMKSCVMEFSASSQNLSAVYTATVLRAGSGVLFNAYKDDYGVDDTDGVVLTCEDVYCISGNKYGVDGKYDHMLIYNQGSNIVMGCELDGAFWESKDASVGGNLGNRTDGVRVKTHGYQVHALKGAYRYDTLALLASAGYSFASLSASGCWSVVGNLPVWGAQ